MRKMVYYIYSAETDLPVCVTDKWYEAAYFIGCSCAQFYRILNTDKDFDGLKVLSWTEDELDRA